MIKVSAFFPSLILLCALAPAPALAQSQKPSSTQRAVFAQTVSDAPAPVALSQPVSAVFPLSLNVVGEYINEAKQLLKSHSGTAGASGFVTLAALDRENSRIQLLPLSKELFLQKGAQVSVTTSLGHQAQVTVIRANGVNTAVTVLDTATNHQLVPLVVAYPIEKDGGYMAYYTSAHPALLSPGIVSDGALYIRTMLDAAVARLHDKGVEISPEIVDIAEHLCIVEHTDHKRFLTENRTALFDEILSLYALNQSDTYRYSVSVAGAGGMVQMIPQTYAMVKAQHQNISLNPDFVGGMTDHLNALQAMLLYMQDTWNDLARNPEIQDALRTGIATQPELVAAGYNSNPVRLASYLHRGGSLWRTLIPAETQMYLQIYGAIDSLLPMLPRSTNHSDTANSVATATSNNLGQRTGIAQVTFSLTQLLPALSDRLLISGSLLTLGLR